MSVNLKTTSAGKSFHEELFFVGELENQIIANAMFGYDGHRGWLNYFAVTLDYQTNGVWKTLITIR